MVYDSVRGVHVVFGGRLNDQLGPLTNETWEYNALTRTWTLRTVSGPSARTDCGLVFDLALSQTVLYSGRDELADLSDTWTYSSENGAWTQRGGSAPSSRSDFAIAYDRDRDVILMLGGYREHAWLGDQWEWNGHNWSLTNRFYCCPRAGAAMVYEDDRHQMLLFGGQGYAPDGTWVLNLNYGPPREPFLYVDWANTGTQDGSFAYPFATVRQVLDSYNYGPGTTIVIKPGDYHEGQLLFCKPGLVQRMGGTTGSVLVH